MAGTNDLENALLLADTIRRNGDSPAMALAKYMDCLAQDPPAGLPNASGEGLKILPGTPRLPMDQAAIDGYKTSIDALSKWVVAPDELAAAQAKLARQLAALDYATK